jgi:hypothetical protein
MPKTPTAPAPRLHRPRLLLAAAALLLAGCAAALPHSQALAQSIRIDVDPAARDTASRRDKASSKVRTLPEALALARELRRSQPDAPAIEIVLAAGLHRLESPVEIGPGDSGTPAIPLVIRGTPGGTSVISGSIPIDPEPGAVRGYDRLQQAARAGTKLYRLPPRLAAIRHIDTARPYALAILVERFTPVLKPSVPFEIFDEQGALRPARWPNNGWAHVEGPGTGGGPGIEWWALTTNAPRLDAWRGEPDLWTAGYWKWDYTYERHRVGEVRSRTLNLATPFTFGLKPGARFHIYHALAELDAPGEWYRDHERNVLLALPRGNDPRLEVSVTASAFVLDGASHVRLSNLTIERFYGDAISVIGGSDVVIERSTLRWAGQRGASFVDARNSGIASSDITDTGEGGVLLLGGDRSTLTPAGLFVRSSRIVRYNRIGYTFKPGIDIAGVGNIVSANYIAQAPHQAIQLQGNDHIIEGNEITDVVNDTTDSGAIYTGLDWTARGSIINNNFIHDIAPPHPGFETKGVYLDDFTSGVTVTGNLFLRVQQPVFIGGGRDNIVESNIFIAAEPAIHIDSRGQDWASKFVTGPASDLRRRLASLPTMSEPWQKRYPSLAGILRDEPGIAKRNVTRNNAVIGGKDFHFETQGDPQRQIIRSPARLRTIAPALLEALNSATSATAIGELLAPAIEDASAPALPYGGMDRASRAGRNPDTR